jgi:thiosulfate/3-mercaptopyruvate sulfurtransferase
LDEKVPKVPKVPVVVSAHDAIESASRPNVVFADVRWYLDGRDARAVHESGRIPGSVFVDVDRDLARPTQSPTEGRHPFPSPAAFAKHMSRLGIGDDTHVIAYDDTGGMTASRLVVMLRMIGHDASLLDGGIDAWALAGGPALEVGPTRESRTARFEPTDWPAHRLIDTSGVHRIIDDRSAILIDARASERFTGAAGVSGADPRAGHIPTARNAPWAAVLSDGSLRDNDELVDHYHRLGIRTGDDAVAYCGSGVSACLNIVALEHIGFAAPRLFVASWSGWASDDGAPIETGESVEPVVTDRSPLDAVRALRKARQKNRLAELEWFEALYRVYLAAFIFGGGILFISGLVPDEAVSDSASADVLRFGPGWLGLALVLALAMGLRSGSRGGPLALEDADVRHVLLAPVSRHRVLLRPAIQKLRSIVFAGAAVGAVAGQLAGRRLPGTSMAWAGSGLLWGATAGAMFVAAALVAHGLRVRGWLATAIGGALLVWQFWSALPGSSFSGPADLHGGLALWGERTRAVEVVPSIVVVALLAIGLVLLGRQSLEALARRSTLVTQLRFAVTLQDLRTVTLLRRQLSHERNRSAAWFKVPGGRRFTPEWRRGWHGLLRFPTSRLMRIVVLAIIAGLCLTAAYEGTTAAIVGSGVALFVLALELCEPLAQEIDHGDRTDAYPRERGRMYVALLAPCVAMAIPVAAIIMLTMWLTDSHDLGLAAIVSVPAVIGGITGACINIVSGAPDQLNTTQQQNMMPPEVAGTASLVKAIWPVVLSIVGGLPMVAAREAIDKGQGGPAAATRTAIAVLLIGFIVGGWVRFRDDIKNWFANAAAESRGQKRHGAST